MHDQSRSAPAVLTSLDEGVFSITLNRPDRLNALNPDAIAQLRDAFECFRDDDAVRVCILTGAGDRAFCAGAICATRTRQTRPLHCR